MTERLRLEPVTFERACLFVGSFHRHHRPPRGHKFSLAAWAGEVMVGAAIVGRPVSRVRDDGMTLEVTRLCTTGYQNACSFLYGAAARATFALGYRRLGTYILASEPGTSLKASGWRLIGETPGRGAGKGWHNRGGRSVADHQAEQKTLWEVSRD